MTVPDASTISRELEMLLDQLHYWARRAHQARGTAEEHPRVGRMLEVATANLETFVTNLLDCFRPLQLAPAPVPVSDVVSAIAMRARRELGVASVTVSGQADGILSVDVIQLTRALSGILRRVGPFASRLHVAVARTDRGGRRGVEIALRSGAGARPRARSDNTGEVEWMLTARIIALHAGELQEHAGGHRRAITLFLPADM